MSTAKVVIVTADPAAVRQLIEQLDLEPLMVKLMDPDEGEGWSLDHVQHVAEWYRRFLYLNALYPNESIVPTKDIDTFWHYHILDTEKYAIDCDTVFGYFLHHFPYFGMRGDEDRQNLLTASEHTWELFRKHFGEEPFIRDAANPRNSFVSACDSSPNCYGTGCTGSKCGTVTPGRERPRLASVSAH